LGFATLSDPKTRFALWVCAIAIILTIVLLIEIIRIRLVFHRNKMSRERFMDLWQPVMLKTVAGEDTPLPPLETKNMRDFILLWLRLQKTIRGEGGEHLNRILRQISVMPYVLKMLRGNKTDERLIAFSVIGFLGDKSVSSDLIAALKDPQANLSVTAAHALVRVDDVLAKSHVIPMIVKRRDWPVGAVAVMLKDASAEFVETFLEAVEKAEIENQPYLLRLMRILEALHLNRPLKFLRHILENSAEPELVTSALKLVQSTSDLDLVRKRTKDANWAVQVQAAIVLGRFGVKEDVPLLVSLMSANDWWVRYRAAIALVQQPFMNGAEIELIKQNMQDAYGSDILSHVLAEQSKS
jgi:HEAT repeats